MFSEKIDDKYKTEIKSLYSDYLKDNNNNIDNNNKIDNNNNNNTKNNSII